MIPEHARSGHRRDAHRPTPSRCRQKELGYLAGREDTAASALDTVATDAAIALIATLPPDQAEAVLLRTVTGLDAETAGRVLGKRAGAARTAAYRGIRKLAGYLDQADGNGPAEATGIPSGPRPQHGPQRGLARGQPRRHLEE